MFKFSQSCTASALRIATALLVPLTAVVAESPFSGSIFIDSDIILSTDPTVLVGAEPSGEGSRQVFDRRENRWVNLNMHLFQLHFADGPFVEARVNQEFSHQQASELVQKYGAAIGRIPSALRRDIDSVTIHDGIMPFGGGNRNLLIHHGQGLIYEADGILEEVFVHEASHTSLDAEHADHPDWRAAQQSDPEFISTYAASFPDREDVAETFLIYLAVDFRPEVLDPDVLEIIEELIPARLNYFREQGLDLHPFFQRKSPESVVIGHFAEPRTVEISWDASETKAYAVDATNDLVRWRKITLRLSPQAATGRIFAQIDPVEKAVFYRVRELGN